MVQLKTMRRFIREGINKIAQLEQRSSQDSVKSYFVRIKKLFEDKLLMAQGDRQMTQRLFKRMSEFPFNYAQRLDEAKEMREVVNKTKYFRLRLDKVSSERPKTDLRETWDLPETDSRLTLD